MIIAVTGTPACGKTTLALELATRLDCQYLNGTQFILEKKLYCSYSRKFSSYLVDLRQFARAVSSIARKARKKGITIILDTHLAHELSPKIVDAVLVCSCSLPILKKRLELRKYSSKKIQENLQAEIFRVCLIDALEKGHRVLEITTNRRLLPRQRQQISSFLEL